VVYVFFGSDRDRVIAKVKSIEESFYKKAGASASAFRFDGDNLDIAEFENSLRAEDIFGQKRLVLARDLFTLDETAKDATKIIAAPFAGGTTLVIYENKLDKDIIKKLEKIGAKIQEYRARAAFVDSRKDGKPLFLISDMLMAKNNRAAFSAYHRARTLGFSAENIFWEIYRQFKNMLILEPLAKIPPSAIEKDTGLHPFVIKKGLGFLRNYRREELAQKFERLMFLWSDAILGPRDLSIDLELFILKS